MVRNAISMQNLHDDIANLIIRSTPGLQTTARTQPGAPSHSTLGDPQQRQAELTQPVQLLGDDAYTKSLMTRIATGQATPEEKAAWEQHVASAKARLRDAAVSQSRGGPSLMATAQAATIAVDGQRNPPHDWSAQLPAALPPAMKPWSEQHSLSAGTNALGGSRDHNNGERNPQWTAAEQIQQPRAPPATPSATPLQPASNHTQTHRDYQMQLMILEQQNRKGLLMAREAQAIGEEEHPLYTDFIHAQRAPPRKLAGHCTAEERIALDGLLKDSIADAPKTAPPSKVQANTGGDMPFKQATRLNAAKYAKPFCDFLTDNPTVFHAVDAVKSQLQENGFTELSERDGWELKAGSSYFVERNSSSLIAFTVGSQYKPGNGAAILAGHVDALTAKLKPTSQVPNKAGYLQLGIAPYAGAPNTTWWDRDLSIGGRVLVKEGCKIVSKLVKLDWPIARIPTLAPHFGAAASGPFNLETQMVPIIGLEETSSLGRDIEPFSQPPILGGGTNPGNTFIQTQPPRLVKAIGDALGLSTATYANIVNWELELFDTQPATLGGLDKEFIFAGRIDDKLCSWAAVQALIEADQSGNTKDSGVIKVVGLFDDEEIGSLLRQGARGNFLPSTLERIAGGLASDQATPDLMGRTYANSFLVSSDVIHAVNPNFLNAYLENHSPHLNVGVVVSADSNGHMTTDSVSTAILQRCADKVGAKLQVFQIRNDSRSGGTVGPMLSAATGIRAIDAGIPQLSMHSIRATTGSLDPGLGVLCFLGFLNGFESVDKEFR